MKRYIIPPLLLLIFALVYNGQTIPVAISGLLWDNSYQKKDFKWAENTYKDILKNHTGSTLIEADVLYNLWNTLYRLGEKASGDEQIKLWKESVGSYTKSLTIRIDKDTEENLAFVKEKLEKEVKKQAEQKKEQEQKKEETTQSGSENKQPPRDEKKEPNSPGSSTTPLNEGGKKESPTPSWKQSPTQKPQSWQNWSNGWSYNPIGWGKQSDDTSKLSDADKQELKEYLEKLKKFEAQNGKLLNPEKRDGVWSISDQIRNFFWEDSFFQDMIPSPDGKKDW